MTEKEREYRLEKEKAIYQRDIERFTNITAEMTETFARKRNDYGQTSAELLGRFGPTSLLVRIYDKFSRLENLLSGKEQKVLDESIYDTFLDLANYAVIAIIELEKQRGMMCSVDEQRSLERERR